MRKLTFPTTLYTAVVILLLIFSANTFAKKRCKPLLEKLYAKLKKVKLKPPKNMTTFNQDSAIVIKSKYQGNKKLAWLQFYQQPIKCQRPKNINMFAFCSEDKLQQRNAFEQQYTQ